MRRTLPILILSLNLLALPLSAGPVTFNQDWNEQRFSIFSSNKYSYKGERLELVSDGTVSLAWRALPRSEWDARTAKWDWSVRQSVPPTDLTRKGGDDRNLSIYFVFLPEAQAEKMQGSSIRSLLAAEDARVLIYVWGGDHARGDILSSPYLGPRGKTLVRRPSGTGDYSESVDLAADYRSAFGGAPGSLVGLAISGDSDDTKTKIRGTIQGLSLN